MGPIHETSSVAVPVGRATKGWRRTQGRMLVAAQEWGSYRVADYIAEEKTYDNDHYVHVSSF